MKVFKWKQNLFKALDKADCFIKWPSLKELDESEDPMKLLAENIYQRKDIKRKHEHR
jgi:hypothetical protein